MLTDKVRHIQQSQKQPAILVIGDLMIDHYIWGDATRLSPEAPVPIVNVKNESTTLGGAANVAQNLVALGAKVNLSGVIGDDAFGARLKEIMTHEGIATDAIVEDKQRPTTVKTRVVAGSHQLERPAQGLDRGPGRLPAGVRRPVLGHVDDGAHPDQQHDRGGRPAGHRRRRTVAGLPFRRLQRGRPVPADHGRGRGELGRLQLHGHAVAAARAARPPGRRGRRRDRGPHPRRAAGPLRGQRGHRHDHAELRGRQLPHLPADQHLFPGPRRRQQPGRPADGRVGHARADLRFRARGQQRADRGCHRGRLRRRPAQPEQARLRVPDRRGQPGGRQGGRDQASLGLHRGVRAVRRPRRDRGRRPDPRRQPAAADRVRRGHRVPGHPGRLCRREPSGRHRAGRPALRGAGVGRPFHAVQRRDRRPDDHRDPVPDRLVRHRAGPGHRHLPAPPRGGLSSWPTR